MGWGQLLWNRTGFTTWNPRDWGITIANSEERRIHPFISGGTYLFFFHRFDLTTPGPQASHAVRFYPMTAIKSWRQRVQPRSHSHIRFDSTWRINQITQVPECTQNACPSVSQCGMELGKGWGWENIDRARIKLKMMLANMLQCARYTYLQTYALYILGFLW